MQVQLDEDMWEMSDAIRLGEALAMVSDLAQAKGCLVTELRVGTQTMTDRELVPPILAQVASSFGSIAAVSTRVGDIVQHSEETGAKFGQQLALQGETLVEDFRQGRGGLRQLDQWFGRMADYLEWLHIHGSVRSPEPTSEQDLSSWINELMQARELEDEVRIADILEYEVIPRLFTNSPSST